MQKRVYLIIFIEAVLLIYLWIYPSFIWERGSYFCPPSEIKGSEEANLRQVPILLSEYLVFKSEYTSIEDLKTQIEDKRPNGVVDYSVNIEGFSTCLRTMPDCTTLMFIEDGQSNETKLNISWYREDYLNMIADNKSLLFLDYSKLKKTCLPREVTDLRISCGSKISSGNIEQNIEAGTGVQVSMTHKYRGVVLPVYINSCEVRIYNEVWSWSIWILLSLGGYLGWLILSSREERIPLLEYKPK